MSADPHQCQDLKMGERLAAYELGLLEPHERRAFEDHLGECAACQERLYELAPYVATLHENPGRYAARLAAALPTARASRPRTGWEHLRRLWKRAGWGGRWQVLVPVVVTAVILFVVIPEQRQPNLPSLARLQPVDYVLLETRAAGLAEGERFFREGMREYADEAYLPAARWLAKALDLPVEEGGLRDRDQAAFFAGLSFLLAGRPDSAKGYLTAAAKTPLRVLAERACWYLAQACLLAADAPCARRNLETLTSSPVYGAAAREQLAELPGPPGDER